MLALLLWVQLQSLFTNAFSGKKKKRTLPLLILVLLCCIYAISSFLTLFFLLFASILPLLEAAGAPHVFFALGGGAAALLMLFGSVVLTKNQLYVANDTEFLLAMPIPPRTILISRLVFLLLINYILGAVIALPMLVAYLFFGTVRALAILTLIIGFLVLPLLCQAISALLAYLLAKVVARLRRKSILVTLGALLLLIPYFAFMFGLDKIMERLLADITPLIRFVDGFLPLALLGRALGGELIPLLGLLLVAAATVGGVLFWLSRTYLQTALGGHNSANAVYREKRGMRRSPLWALTVREFIHLGSSSGYMLNAGLGILFIPAFSIWLLIDGSLLDAVKTLGTWAEAILPALMAAACMGLCAMVFFSACSVSLEGRTLWLVRTAPIPTRTVLLSKCLFHALLVAPCALASGVMISIAVGCTAPTAILLTLTILFFSLFSAVFGLAANLWLPKLEWKNELVPIKQGGATLVAMFGNAILAALFGGIAILLSLVAPWLGLLASTLLTLGATIGMLAYILTIGVRQFEAL